MRSSFNFFELPPDLIRHILLNWLHGQGPRVVLLDAKPSEAQKQAVLARSGPSLSYDKNGSPYYAEGDALDLSVYHLIAAYSDEAGKMVYSIGFCRRDSDGDKYVTKVLGKKSPLLRYVSEDFQHPEYSQLFPYDRQTQMRKLSSRDRLLIKYFEREIQAESGVVHCHQKNAENLLRAFKDFPLKGAELSRKEMISNTLQHWRLENLLHHAAYGEQAEVIKLLREDITLLESGKKASVQLCSPEMFCPEISFLDLVIVFGDWFLGREIVKAINQSDLTEEEKNDYKTNFFARVDAREKNGIEAILDNLLNKGIQILDADILEANPAERKRYEQDVVERKAYHLIIQTFKEKEKRSVISCVLGFRDPETGKYVSKEIPEDHELFKVAALELYEGLKAADDGHGVRLAHYFTRANRDLTLVREELKANGVETQIKTLLRPSNFENLLKFLEKGIQGWTKENWTADRSREQWYGETCAELRLFTPLEWQLWLSHKNPWSLNEDEIKAFVNSAARPSGDKNYYNDPIFPCSSSLGDRFIASWARGCAPQRRRRQAAAGLLKSILKVEQQEWKNLKTCLLADVNLTSSAASAVCSNTQGQKRHGK